MFLRSLLPLACVLLLAFSSCAMPSRVGYDRDRGSYANMPRTGNAGEEGASVATGAVVTADSSWNAIFVSWLVCPFFNGIQ